MALVLDWFWWGVNPLLGSLEGGLFRTQMALAISEPKKVSKKIFRFHPFQWPSKWICSPQNHYIPCHLNNRYISSYYNLKWLFWEIDMSFLQKCIRQISHHKIYNNLLVQHMVYFFFTSEEIFDEMWKKSEKMQKIWENAERTQNPLKNLCSLQVNGALH